MKIESRSYSADSFYPAPEVFLSVSEQLIVVATSWADRSDARAVIDAIRDLFLVTGDKDATQHFSSSTSLDPLSQRLRSSLLSAHEQLFISRNKEEYQAAVEVLALSWDQQMNLSFARVGAPHLFYYGQNVLHPLSYTVDTSFAWQQSSPLPAEVIGVEASVRIQTGQFKAQRQDKIFLLSRSGITSSFFSAEKTIHDLTRSLVNDQPEKPFWIAELTW
ncbi:MAG: hypothetical protein LW875_11115 [Proteobacteria bacterium]|jgi:hypothetical protein|nr:hypothetical protein [Pseudomonadota bacterium]